MILLMHILRPGLVFSRLNLTRDPRVLHQVYDSFIFKSLLITSIQMHFRLSVLLFKPRHSSYTRWLACVKLLELIYHLLSLTLHCSCINITVCSLKLHLSAPTLNALLFKFFYIASIKVIDIYQWLEPISPYLLDLDQPDYKS